MDIMTKNLGAVDRGLRLGAALVLILAAFTLPAIANGPLQWIAVGAGIVFALTSFVSFCPLYTLLGVRTCKEC